MVNKILFFVIVLLLTSCGFDSVEEAGINHLGQGFHQFQYAGKLYP